MAEEDFYQINGNSYRGSRYANFGGGGVTPQGNTSSAATENATSQIANENTSQPAGGGSGAQTGGSLLPTAQQTSSNTAARGSAAEAATPSIGQMAKNVVIGAGLPMAGSTIGSSIGSSLAMGQSFGQGLSNGVNALGSKVSAGLIGSPGGATNAALSSMSGAGPATSGAVSKAASGANIGGAVGAGLGTAAATLLMGGDVKTAVKSGVGTAAGTALGNLVVPGIGGFIGGTIGSMIFCFTEDTPILMADGTTKKVSDLRLLDEVYLGGKVTGRGEVFSSEIFDYKNTRVTGGHAVFENGVWTRVRDSHYAQPVDIAGPVVVCPVETENRLLVTPWFISSDITEIPEETWEYTEAERLEMLNAQTEENAQLVTIEREIQSEPISCGAGGY